ncbi:MAG: Rieske 2Fe-2S domain-containing protein, partial [Chloroflexota bacterium]
MLSKRENELLTRVGPGTPMGALMRRYWHPVAASQELDASPFRTKEVRVLGEDLVLYRDRSGQLGLVDRWCSHRRVNLAYGVVEQDGLRCQYHGWKFDHSGACTEQPFEETVHPDGRFKEKCGIAAYSTREAGGLVF